MDKERMQKATSRLLEIESATLVSALAMSYPIPLSRWQMTFLHYSFLVNKWFQLLFLISICHYFSAEMIVDFGPILKQTQSSWLNNVKHSHDKDRWLYIIQQYVLSNSWHQENKIVIKYRNSVLQAVACKFLCCVFIFTCLLQNNSVFGIISQIFSPAKSG